ncbi:MAG: hypothetical protein ABIG67_06490 [Pseudomonadota bacterium]
MGEPIIPILIFITVYILISFEVLNKAIAALLGVMFLLVVGLTFNQFIAYLPLPVFLSFIGVIFYCWLANRERFRRIDINVAKLFFCSTSH